MPVVSVIVPTYNRKELLEDCINSILDQMFGDYEIIIVDDGSTDGTGVMITNNDDRIHYFYKEHGGTPAAVRNVALKHATGEYIAFCDDDDLWLPQKLEKQVKILDQRPELLAVGTNCVEFPGVPTPVLKYTRDHLVSFKELSRENCVFTSGLMVRKEAIRNGFDERSLDRYLEDYALAFKITRQRDRSILILKEPLFRYRLRGTRHDLARFRDYHIRKLLLQKRAIGKGGFVVSLQILRIRVGSMLEGMIGKIARNLFKRLLSSPGKCNDSNRLVIYTENYLVGGLDKFIKDIVDNFHEKPVLLYNRGNTSLPQLADSVGIQHFPLLIKQTKTPNNGLKRVISMVGRRLTFLANYRTLSAAFADVKAGRVLVVNGGYPGADSCRAAILAAARVGSRTKIISILSSPTLYYVSGSTSIMGILQRAFHTIDWIIDDLVDVHSSAIHVNCTPARGEMVEFMQFNPRKIHVIPTGIELPPKTSQMTSLDGDWKYPIKKEGEVWVGTVGRLDSLKGQEYLIRAFELLKYDKRIHCLIVGRGPDYQRLSQITHDLGIESQVHLIGSYAGDINDIYRFLDIFVLPSLHEGLPYVVEEAMAHGLPVVATNVGGVPDLIEDGVTGLLVPSADPKAITDAILKLINKPHVRNRVGVTARKMIEEKFTIEKMVKDLEELLK